MKHRGNTIPEINGQLAYLAGLFDGEGSFSIQVNIRAYKGRENVHFNPRMTMTLRYGTEVLKELQQEFGGQLYTYKDGTARWNLSRREELTAATQALLPYLRIKKDIAQRFLEALALFPTSRKAHRTGERTWTEKLTLQVGRIALNLNPYRKSPKALGYLQQLERVYQT